MEEDSDIDMPYAPPLPSQPTVSRCPHPQASQHSMQTANTRRPSHTNSRASYPDGNNMNPSAHGTSNMPPISYGGPSQGDMPPTNYTAALRYDGHYAHWSQDPLFRGATYPGHLDPQAPGSRRFLPLPHVDPPPWTPPISSLWGDLYDDSNTMTRYPEPDHVARNNNPDPTYIEFMDDNRPSDLTRTQVAQRRRRRNAVATEMEALQNLPSNVSSRNPNLSNSPEWGRPSARQGRLLAEAQRGFGPSPHVTRDSDTEDDEFGDTDDDLEELLRFTPYLRDSDEGADFALRGRLWSAEAKKRLPTKEFLLSLESLKPDDLSKEERTCIICYNEFGVKNPEGVSEQPLRVPKCKHIFGAICIKKWFKENDTCPYCRDKVPSESSRKVMMRHARQVMQEQIRRRHHSTARSTTEANPSFSIGPNPQEAQNMSSGDRTSPTWSRPLAAEAAEPRPLLQHNVRHNSDSERVSPAIAVGSTTNNGDQQSTPLSTNSLGQSTNPNGYMSPTSVSSTNPPFSTGHMYPTTLPHSQNRPVAFGSVRPLQQEHPSQFYHYHGRSPHADNSATLPNRQQALQQAMQQQQQILIQQERFRQEEAEGERSVNVFD
ncbi:hypothetical protein EYC84_011287 [Monilinia fructicola]|uniref:RING-type domain-containing protein n=1 Tax=Monilinia fructicola TaxID=38448 RepID=A0A5M9J7U9_MONFR|nr:hypothetical protein EYC84_011287 [Monilinia fructicola]